MWPRHAEVVLGFWLAISPFVFGHPPDAVALWTNDLACAAVLVVVPLLTYRAPLRRAHLLLLPLAAWLVGLGWTVALLHGATPASQNHVLVGLLVAMMAILPTEAAKPPPGWRAGRETPGGFPPRL